MVQPLLHEQLFDAICRYRPTYHIMEYTCVGKAVRQTWVFIGLPDVTACEPVDPQSRQPSV